MQFCLKHQTQPTPVTCVATSIAIIAGIDRYEAMGQFHEEYYEGDLSIRNMLDRLGIKFQSFDTADRNSIAEPGVYLCSTPSLNVVGGMHQVVVVELHGPDKDCAWQVLDPAQGLNVGGKQRKYYTAYEPTETEPNAVQFLAGYTIDVFIKFEDLPNEA